MERIMKKMSEFRMPIFFAIPAIVIAVPFIVQHPIANIVLIVNRNICLVNAVHAMIIVPIKVNLKIFAFFFINYSYNQHF